MPTRVSPQDFSLLKFSKGWYPEAETLPTDFKPFESDGDTEDKIWQKPSGEGVWDFPISVTRALVQTHVSSDLQAWECSARSSGDPTKNFYHLHHGWESLL